MSCRYSAIFSEPVQVGHAMRPLVCQVCGFKTLALLTILRLTKMLSYFTLFLLQNGKASIRPIVFLVQLKTVNNCSSHFETNISLKILKRNQN